MTITIKANGNVEFKAQGYNKELVWYMHRKWYANRAKWNAVKKVWTLAAGTDKEIEEAVGLAKFFEKERDAKITDER